MSKIPTVEEWLYPAGVPEKELDHYLEIVKYAELVRAETLNLAAKKATMLKDLGEDEKGNWIIEKLQSYNDEEGYPIYIDKQSILDLITHPNLEIK